MLSWALLAPLLALSLDLDACAASVGADGPRGIDDPRYLAAATWAAEAVVYARVLEIKHDLHGPYPTLVDLLVTSVQKGEVPPRIRVVQRTGPVYSPAYGSIVEIVSSHSHDFEPGQQLILFLERGQDDRLGPGEYHAFPAISVEGQIGRMEQKAWWIREIEREVRRIAVAQETGCRQVSTWDPAFLSGRELDGDGLDAALLEQLRLELLMSDRGRRFVLGLEPHLPEIRQILSADPALAVRLTGLRADVRAALLHLLYRDIGGRDVVLDGRTVALLHEVGRRVQEVASPELAIYLDALLGEIRRLQGLPVSEAYPRLLTISGF